MNAFALRQSSLQGLEDNVTQTRGTGREHLLEPRGGSGEVELHRIRDLDVGFLLQAHLLDARFESLGQYGDGLPREGAGLTAPEEGSSPDDSNPKPVNDGVCHASLGPRGSIYRRRDDLEHLEMGLAAGYQQHEGIGRRLERLVFGKLNRVLPSRGI